MKNKFIRITSITDIDKSKISVYDLNNRYIDATGNLFGLKYNKMEKKVEIIKLLRTHAENAGQIQHDMIVKKISNNRYPGPGTGPDTINDLFDEDHLIIDEDDSKNPVAFINRTLAAMKTHAQRFRGIINNITNSNVFPRENKADSIELQDIFRSFEIDGIQKIDKIVTYHDELKSYPRSVSYYQSKLDKRGRDIIDELEGNNEKIILFIFQYEMLISINELYQNLKNLIGNLMAFIDRKESLIKKNIPTAEKKLFQDAVTTIETTITEIDGIIEKIEPFMEIVTNLDEI